MPPKAAPYAVARMRVVWLVGGFAAAVASSCRLTSSPFFPRSALRNFLAALLEIVNRTIFDVPAGIVSFWRPRSIDTGLTTLRFLPLPTTFALPRCTSVAVAVNEQVVSHPTRTGRLRAVSRPALRRILTVSCGPSGSGSVGYFSAGVPARGRQWRTR